MLRSYRKTVVGRAEIRDRTLPLSRTARNLLLIIEPSQPAHHWLNMLLGATETDLVALLRAGLIEYAPLPEAVPAEFVSNLSYGELYDSLNGLIREQLGLFKGYRFSLEIEKANGIDEMRAVAQRFVVEVRKAKGESAAQMVRRALGLSA